MDSSNSKKTSLASIKRASEFVEFVQENEPPRTSEEKQWRLSSLRHQFKSLNLHTLFKTYTNKIAHGYFSLFLILQFLLSLTHFLVLFFSVYYTNESDLTIVIPDLILYGLIVLLTFAGIILVDRIENNFKFLQYLSSFALIFIFFINFFIPVYHYLNNVGNFRPAYSTHLIISCYVFLNIDDNMVAFIAGFVVSVVNICVLSLVTYVGNTMIWQRLASDTLFIICINCMGINFRYLNEIAKRRSFLDRRDCIVSTLQLKIQKDQEEHLLSSIIPKNLIHIMKKDFFEILQNMEDKHAKNDVFSEPFSKKFLEHHDNVTILFADIVNYTEMTTKLSINDLLETLNELFTSFDDASEEFKVTRIKFLGDCYYCVSGLPPNPPPNHAEACVDLGLQMISIIAGIRQRRRLNIDMRIGVHTGEVISGIIGKVKYQFDVWSKDVDLANKMETEGTPGKVHITNTTKNLLQKSYELEETDKGNTVNLFKELEIKTFLITPSDEFDVKYSVTFKQTNRQSSEVSSHPRPSLFKKKTSNMSNNNKSSSKTYLSNLHEESISTFDGDQPNDNVENIDPVISNSSNEASNSNDNRISNSSTYYQNDEQVPNNYRNSVSKRRFSGALSNSSRRLSRVSEEKMRLEKIRRTAFMNINLKRYNELSTDADKEMERTISELTFSKYNQFFRVKEISNLLCFRDKTREKGYLSAPDPLFKYYLLSQLLVIVCVFLIQNLTLESWNWTQWPFYVSFFVILLLLPLTWTYFIWTRYVMQWTEEDIPNNIILKFLYQTSTFITSQWIPRVIIYIVVSIVFSYYVFSEVLECESYEEDHKIAEKDSFINLIMKSFREGSKINTVCIVPWHMTETSSLAIIMSFLFIRTHIWLKFISAASITVTYCICVETFTESFYKNGETINYLVKPQTAHIMSVIFLTFILHLIDRQTDYMNKLDFLLTETFKENQEETQKLQIVNKIMLVSILPKNVAKLYLDVSRDMQELYHEHHLNVAVMFASMICDDLTKMNDIDILKLMNTYITKFDVVSKREEFNGKIEKIKMSKWTYMAACGLMPGNEHYTDDIHSSVASILTLLEFATNLMKETRDLNKSSFQNVTLRIGISHGPIVAGVVGSRKPLYDIWGDAVNMASRMDSTGVPDRIQIMPETAEIVKSLGFKCESRGEIFVKGRKTLVETYFVTLNPDTYSLIRV